VATLHLLCGKIAAGKSTLADVLAAAPGCVRLDEDTLMATLYPGEIATLEDYSVRTLRLEAAIGPHVAALLRAGLDVVMDFHANTRRRRAWMRGLVEASGCEHRLHVLDVTDAVCLERLHARNAAGTHRYAVTDEEFHAFTRYYDPPEDDEGFRLVRHGGAVGRGD
jgi:predicted kinase